MCFLHKRIFQLHFKLSASVTEISSYSKRERENRTIRAATVMAIVKRSFSRKRGMKLLEEGGINAVRLKDVEIGKAIEMIECWKSPMNPKFHFGVFFVVYGSSLLNLAISSVSLLQDMEMEEGLVLAAKTGTSAQRTVHWVIGIGGLIELLMLMNFFLG